MTAAATAKAPRARKPKPAEPVTAAGARRELVKLLQANADQHQLWTVWSDFVEMAAIALAGADLSQRERREARYLEIVKRYKPEQVNRFAQALGALTLSLEEEPSDVLGSVFMELGLGSKWAGQFFTPFHLCRVMAKLNIGDGDDIRQQIAEHGHITANDPAVGAGATLIAFAVELAELDINYQEHLHVTAQDIDARAAHMAFVQLSLLHVPAVVVVGDTLRMEFREAWYTPAHILGGWSWRLRGAVPPGRLIEAIAAAAARGEPANQADPEVAAAAIEATTAPPPGQLSLALGDAAPAPRARRSRAA